jgi:hypothetical protein
MRCLSCGEHLSRERLGVAGAGFALCTPCISVFHELSTGSFPVHLPTSRPAWGIGQVDPSAVEHLTDEELRREVEVAKELIAPFVSMIETGERKLAGDPNWRPVIEGTHRHQQSIELPNGVVVDVASYIGNEDHSGRQSQPTFGVYLDPVWSPPWQHIHIEWPDFGVPSDVAALRRAVVEILRRAGQAGERVEIGCIGGHGRTGTLLAILALMAGLPDRNAVAWVRQTYCSSAVETAEQEQFINSFEW